MLNLHNPFFPEELWPPVNKNYSQQVSQGLYNASKLNVLFCGIVRDCEPALERNLLCLDYMRKFFRESSVFLYENDSQDSTKEILEKYAKSHYSTIFSTETLGTEKLSNTSLTRRTNMANARNKYLEFSKSHAKKTKLDKVIILDLDLLGGWSYTGLLTSLNYLDNTSCFGSNSILYRDNVERLYYDTWAYLDSNNQSEADKNLLRFHRGEPMVSVTSCFGGMMVYPASILQQDVEYTNEDCDHVTLNKQLTQLGYNVYLNPSQITLYSKHYYIT